MQLQQQQLQQPLLSRLPATLISGCGMATRVEQQQAANPGVTVTMFFLLSLPNEPVSGSPKRARLPM
jgi:hypothetical protein